jgi:hypothetical protein
MIKYLLLNKFIAAIIFLCFLRGCLNFSQLKIGIAKYSSVASNTK